MNGWFTNVPDNWPPSESINPLYVSFHLNAKASDKILSKQENVDYFKRHEPIGCRDVYTAESLRRKGIDAYFSGCLTLTIGDLYKTEECSDKVYIVDPYFKGSTHPHPVFKGIFLICTKPLMIKKIAKGLYHNTSFKSMLLAAQFYNIYTKIIKSPIFYHFQYIFFRISFFHNIFSFIILFLYFIKISIYLILNFVNKLKYFLKNYRHFV